MLKYRSVNVTRIDRIDPLVSRRLVCLAKVDVLLVEALSELLVAMQWLVACRLETGILVLCVSARPCPLLVAVDTTILP